MRGQSASTGRRVAGASSWGELACVMPRLLFADTARLQVLLARRWRPIIFEFRASNFEFMPKIKAPRARLLPRYRENHRSAKIHRHCPLRPPDESLLRPVDSRERPRPDPDPPDSSGK